MGQYFLDIRIEKNTLLDISGRHLYSAESLINIFFLYGNIPEHTSESSNARDIFLILSSLPTMLRPRVKGAREVKADPIASRNFCIVSRFILQLL